MSDDEDDCACEFERMEGDEEEPPDYEPWHYRRVCDRCGCIWGSLHCVHDGIQRGCPDCSWKPVGTRSAADILGLS